MHARNASGAVADARSCGTQCQTSRASGQCTEQDGEILDIHNCDVLLRQPAVIEQLLLYRRIENSLPHVSE